MGTNYDWAGSKIMPYPLVRGKRRLHWDTPEPIWMDIRDFVMPPNRPQIMGAFESLNVDVSELSKDTGNFDERARRCWFFMAGGTLVEDDAQPGRARLPGDAALPVPANRPIKYCPDPNRLEGSEADFWQLPTETMSCFKGDCEDMAILLVSLMIGHGISPYCVRVVVGQYVKSVAAEAVQLRAHAWVVYKTEQGPWCLIDPTWDSAMYKPTGWHFAEACDDGIRDAEDGLRHHYVPSFGFNCDHAWEIYPLPSAPSPAPQQQTASRNGENGSPANTYDVPETISQ